MIGFDGMKCLFSGEVEGLRRGSASSSHSDPVIEMQLQVVHFSYLQICKHQVWVARSIKLGLEL